MVNSQAGCALQIPVLEDSDLGVPLFESRSILRCSSSVL